MSLSVTNKYLINAELLCKFFDNYFNNTLKYVYNSLKDSNMSIYEVVKSAIENLNREYDYFITTYNIRFNADTMFITMLGDFCTGETVLDIQMDFVKNEISFQAQEMS